MANLSGRARRWWGGAGLLAPAVPYELTCSCGQVSRGVRQRRSQVVSCPACQQALFVLPISRYPPPDQLAATPPSALNGAAPAPAPSHPWLLPLLAAGLTLLLVVVAFALILPRLGRHPTTPALPAISTDDIQAHERAGQKALAEGSFQLALEELTIACDLRDQHPQLLSPAESRRLNQLQREASLLAALLRNSLQEILNQAATVRRDQEWKAQFRDNYRGRTVIFDDVVRREADGQCHLTVYDVRLKDAPARLELGKLALLQSLPLDRPQRLVFGARLDSIARDEAGVWVIRFKPDSGVLLTDAEVAATASPLPLDDELQAVLRRQAEWAAELP